MKCMHTDGCADDNAIHYLGAGIWVCFRHWLSALLGVRLSPADRKRLGR